MSVKRRFVESNLVVGYSGVTFVREVDKQVISNIDIPSGDWQKMVENDKALNFGICRGQKAALVREEGITDAKQMRVFTRLSVTADKKPQVYALV